MEPVLSPAQPNVVPRHMAIIMDGNGRWAKARGLPRAAGHKAGAEAVRRSVECAREMGIGYLTLYAFSAENWKRPMGEVTDLMGLLSLYLRREIANLHRNGIRFQVIGDRSRLSPDIVKLITEAELQTKDNPSMTLILALSYGGRQEIVAAAKRLAAEVLEGTRSLDQIDEDALEGALYTAGVPDPDLIIRTSGEQRMSNFLLWQSAYSELVFVDVLWPDFGRDDIERALDDYNRRERRFGAAGS